MGEPAVTVQFSGTLALAARQHPPGRNHKQTAFIARREGRRLPAAALPGAPEEVRHPRLRAAIGPRAWDQLANRAGVRAQRLDHGRLGGELGRVQPAVAEARADGGDAHEVTQIELETHNSEQFERQVKNVYDTQGCHRGAALCLNGVPVLVLDLIHVNDAKNYTTALLYTTPQLPQPAETTATLLQG
jgi:hypothetical protein